MPIPNGVAPSWDKIDLLEAVLEAVLEAA